MNINDIESQGFVIKSGTIANEEVYLISPPHMGITWTNDNLIYRSSIWNKEGKPVSLGWKKFANFGEKPDLFVPPSDLKNTQLLDKLDGSCLIISKYKGELITRTRGTFNARTLDNGKEIDLLVKKYPNIFDNEFLNSEQYSIICEWLSPINVIVIKYGDEPDLVLTGIINHNDYSYMTQSALDICAKKWSIKRPDYYSFNDINSMMEGVKNLKGKEGLCLYYNNGQNILKVKSAEYLMLHSFKSNCTYDSLIDMYLEWDMPSYNDFYNRILSMFDYECANMARSIVSHICDTKKEIDKIVEHMKLFVEPLKSVPRKDAALKILSSYGQGGRSGIVFTLLDNKPIGKDNWKKLIFQSLNI